MAPSGRHCQPTCQPEAARHILPPIPSRIGTHIIITIDNADSLLIHAEATAALEGTTVRQLVEAGLRTVLQQRSSRPSSFALRNASFKGQGLQAGVTKGNWDECREQIYEGRGGR